MACTKKTVAIFIIALLTLGKLSFAQKGKISGTVIDDALKQPLIGVNVFLEGTTVGSTTDIDGKYVILNINPGVYTVTASMVGFGKVSISDVQVFIDRTTEVNFKLQDESIQMEQVVIKAEKPKIVRDQTSTSTTLDDTQIKAAPIEGLRGSLDLSASFQKDEKGDYSVRGSGNYEVQFQINGVAQITSSTSIPGYGGADKANNSWKYDVNPLGVQQVQLITGGFSAEYGNAQAGVVKVALKEGTPILSGEFRVEYSPPGQYHFGNYIYDNSNFEWRTWGNFDYWIERQKDVITQISRTLATRMYVSGTATAEDSARAMAELEWAYNTWLNNHTPSDDNVMGVYDYTGRAYTRYLFGFGGPLGADPEKFKFYFSGEYRKSPTRLPTPEKDQIYQNYIVNATYVPFTQHKLKFTGTYQKYRGGLFSGSTDIRWAGLTNTTTSDKYAVNQDPVRTEQTIGQGLNWIYTINNNSFVEATISHQYETFELPYVYLPGWNSEVDRLDSLADPSGVVLKDGLWWDTEYFRRLEAASTNFYQDGRTNQWSLNADYTNQITQTNLLKSGIRFSYWDIMNNGVAFSYRSSSYVAWSGVAEYYRAYPINFAFYVQDKMEYEGMVANIGLRVESYDFQANVPADIFNVFYPATQGPGPVGNPLTTPSETQFVLLPRLGISFPIGETTAFRLQYGHFASMPIFTQALVSKTFKGISALGNPNLEPKKTINYEFGLQQVIDEDHRLDLAIYYNDRSSQIGLQEIAGLTGDVRYQDGFTNDNQALYKYQSWLNNSFGSTLGMELTFEKISLKNWSYRLSYNLSQTTLGRYGSAVLYPDNTRNQTQRGTTGEFISPTDRTHSFRGLLQYFLRDQEGLEIFGFYPFENTVFSLTYLAQSGTPYRYITTFELNDISFNRRYPVEWNFDFNFTKEIRFSTYKIILGMRIMNLFDNKWITPFSESDADKLDKENWVEKGVTMDNPAGDPTRKSYLLYPFRAYRNVPRQIFITIGFGF